MKCYKCHEEMFPCMDTAWKKHHDGTKYRSSEWVCVECRVYVAVDVFDYEECSDLNELLKEVEE